MTVRNFWIEATVDGRETPIVFGPRAKDGGFTLRIYQRDKGISRLAVSVVGQHLYGTDQLQLTVTSYIPSVR
jgi:hypothetical protein